MIPDEHLMMVDRERDCDDDMVDRERDGNMVDDLVNERDDEAGKMVDCERDV